MQRSIATICVNGTLRTKLRAIADAGFEHVEIFESDLLACPEPVAVVGAMMRDQGLACAAFQPFRDFEGMPTRLRARVFDRAERKFDVMEELGTDLVLVTSNVSPESLGERGRIVDDLRELGDRAAARGLRVGFEALAWGRTCQRSPSGVGDRARSRSSRGGPGARFVQLACAQRTHREPAVDRSRRSCSTSSSPMRRRCRWIRCRGAGTSAACRGRAICRWWSTSRRFARSAIRACCRWRSSTTAFLQALRLRLRWTGCVHSRTCWSRLSSAWPARRRWTPACAVSGSSSSSSVRTRKRQRSSVTCCRPWASRRPIVIAARR